MIVGNRQHKNADILLWVHFLPQLKFKFSPILNWPSQHSFQASFLSNSLQIEWFCVCMWREQGLLDIWNALISLIFEPTCNWKMSSTFQTKDAVANKGLFKQKWKDTLWFWNGMFGNTRITQEASTQTEREWWGKTTGERKEIEGEAKWGETSWTIIYTCWGMWYLL